MCTRYLLIFLIKGIASKYIAERHRDFYMVLPFHVGTVSDSVVVHVLDGASHDDVFAPPTSSAIPLTQWVTDQGELARVVASMLQKQPESPVVRSVVALLIE